MYTNSYHVFKTRLIGENGNSIEKLKEVTSSKIWIENQSDSFHVIVHVKNANKLVEAVEKVEEKIHTIISKFTPCTVQ